MNNLALATHHVSVSTKGGKSILTDISLSFFQKETTVVMGPNGSGKSTFAHALLGSPEYVVTGKITLGATDLSKLPTEKRAKNGLFLSFQSPVAVRGISVMNLLRAAAKERDASVDMMKVTKEILHIAEELHIESQLVTRSINDGFSGGERKKIELLQAMVLRPRFAIFDEIDTGLDVDALKIVAEGIQRLHKQKTGCIIITHYQRLLSYIHPDRVVVFGKGKVKQTGGPELASSIEKQGYENL